MVKNYLLLLALFSFCSITAQTITFSDPNFKKKLLSLDGYNNIAKDSDGNNIKIDKNNNKQIEESEALSVSSLKITCNGCTNAELITNLSEISYFTNLKDLDCSHNLLVNLDFTKLQNLETLVSSYNYTKNLQVKGLTKLKTLSVGINMLESIDVSGLTNLENLYVNANLLKTLKLEQLHNLKTVSGFGNQLTSIDIIDSNNLVSLEVTRNLLTELNLPQLNLLKDLDCNENKITSLDLSKIPNIINLNCSSNKITSLDFKNLKTEKITCNLNELTKLDLKGLKTLKYLQCASNKLPNLDLTDQPQLQFLDCSYNLFTELNFNNCLGLNNLVCANNSELVAILIKNNVLSYNLNFDANPKLKYICTTDDYIDHYKKLLADKASSVEVNSYCTFDPGATFYTIQGNQKYDADKNGCDILDGAFPNLNFSITNGAKKSNIISDISGNYNIYLGSGDYTINPILENPKYFTVSPESLKVTFPNDGKTFTQDFCIVPNGVHQDVEITILPTVPARPGFDAVYKIVYKNKATKAVSGSVTLDFNDAVLDYISSVPNTTSQNTNKLVWDYADLKPFESREIQVTLNVNSPMETPPVKNNDRLSFNALVTPVTGDEKPVDNSFALRQMVVGSFDPNDKTCLEGDVITPELIGEYVHYLIRFENTGTYPAENIVVKDIIDTSKFDISTLAVTNASHSYITKISDGNKVEFIFEKINLPFNDANNDGYITFKIKTLPTLSVGDSFTNEANIYFDYNFPILTNKATSTFKTLGTQDFEFANYFSIYPNPVKETLNITAKNNIELKSIAIYDILGQLVIAVPNAQDVSKVDVSNLRTGNYILKVKTDNGTSSVKFIKL